MAIQNVQWSNGDKITTTKLTSMVSDETNYTDDIHPQYFGKIVGSASSDIEFSSQNIQVGLSGSGTMTMPVGSDTVFYPLLGFVLKNSIDSTIIPKTFTYDFVLNATSAVVGDNYAQVRYLASKAGVTAASAAGATQHAGTAWTSATGTVDFETALTPVNLFVAGTHICVGLELYHNTSKSITVRGFNIELAYA